MENTIKTYIDEYNRFVIELAQGWTLMQHESGDIMPVETWLVPIVSKSQEMRNQYTEHYSKSWRFHGHEAVEFTYQAMDQYLDDLFSGGPYEYHHDLGWSGIAMFSGNGILERYYYPEESSLYNANDDDLGTDWKKSKLWYYNNYCFDHPVETLAKDGKVIFDYSD